MTAPTFASRTGSTKRTGTHGTHAQNAKTPATRKSKWPWTNSTPPGDSRVDYAAALENAAIAGEGRDCSNRTCPEFQPAMTATNTRRFTGPENFASRIYGVESCNALNSQPCPIGRERRGKTRETHGAFEAVN